MDEGEEDEFKEDNGEGDEDEKDEGDVEEDEGERDEGDGEEDDGADGEEDGELKDVFLRIQACPGSSSGRSSISLTATRKLSITRSKITSSSANRTSVFAGCTFTSTIDGSKSI